MDADQVRRRTKRFGLEVIRLVQRLPRSAITEVLGRQLLRAGTSVGANYRAACRARSPAEFVAKMGIVEEEADEALYWLEMLVEAELIDQASAAPLVREANEIVAMTVSSIRTARPKGR